jgi:selenocysteine lyase/cysteine desulfurase
MSMAWFPAMAPPSPSGSDADAVLARLRQANVVVSVRAGRIRLAVHFYNLDEEIDRVAELIGHP